MSANRCFINHYRSARKSGRRRGDSFRYAKYWRRNYQLGGIAARVS